MFKKGDLVTIKEAFRNPGETDRLYRIVDVNDATKRCYVELAVCDLPISPQELVSFEMIHLFRTAPTKVHLNDRSVLEDAKGIEYTDIPKDNYFMSQLTGEVFCAFKTDEMDNVVEIEPLAQYMIGIKRIMDEGQCDRATAERIYPRREWSNYPSANHEAARHTVGMQINLEKLKTYLEDEMIIEFASPEACMEYFNTYDGQDFKSVDEMKDFQAEYGFGVDGKWYHINFDEALDIWEQPSFNDRLRAAATRAEQAREDISVEEKNPER